MRFNKSLILSTAIVVASTAFASGLFTENKHDLGLSLTFSVVNTDNRDQTPDKYIERGVEKSKESQTQFRIGPVLTYTKRIEDRLDASFTYAPVYTERDSVRNGAEKSTLNHSVDGRLAYALNSITMVELSDSYAWTGQRSYFYGDDYSYNPNRDSRLSEDYWQNTIKAAIERSMAGGTCYARLSGRYRVKRYEADEIASYSDEDEYGARLDFFRVRNRYLSYGLYADYTSWDRESSASRYGATMLDLGVQYINYGFQVRYDLNGNKDHEIYASVGCAHVEYESDLDSQDVFGDSRIELRLFQQSQTSLLAGIRYGVDYSDVYPFSTQDDMASYIFVRHNFDLDKKYYISAALEYRLRKYNLRDDLDPNAARYGYVESLKAANNGSEDFDRTSVYVKLTAGAKLTESLSASLYYTYEDIDSDVGSSFTENCVGVSGTIKFF